MLVAALEMEIVEVVPAAGVNVIFGLEVRVVES
jgi:hypothetical protein